MSVIYTFKTKEIALRKGVPLEIVKFLGDIVNDQIWTYAGLPHPLFKTERWFALFAKSGWYEDCSYFQNRNGYWRLFIHCDINKGSEGIEQFVDWITPFVAGHKPKEFLGRVIADRDYEYNVYIERKPL